MKNLFNYVIWIDLAIAFLFSPYFIVQTLQAAWEPITSEIHRIMNPEGLNKTTWVTK